MTPFRVAVRKFAPFERAIARQWSTSAGDSPIEIVAMDLIPLHEAVFEGGGRRDMAFMPPTGLPKRNVRG